VSDLDYPSRGKGSELVSQKCSDFRLQTPFPGTRHCEGSGLIRLEVCRTLDHAAGIWTGLWGARFVVDRAHAQALGMS
jgi:hypothetical protein